MEVQENISKPMVLYKPITLLLKEACCCFKIAIRKMWNWNDNDPDYSYEKFYLGGSTSMRAWDVLRFKVKDGVPSGDIIRLMANLESRIDLYKSIGLTFLSMAVF